MHKLHWQTVTPQLKEILLVLMQASIFDKFRLVGGTALSLQIGHRLSIDIDLFTDSDYGSINFNQIEDFLKHTFSYVDTIEQIPIAFGKSFYIGNNKDYTVKLDLYYTDNFIQEPLEIQGVRMASIEEIIAMKIDVIQRKGRKKDFWDLHELITTYSVTKILSLHKKRYPYTHEKTVILHNIKNCSTVDNDFDPICLKNKVWQFVKMDLIDFIK